MGPIRVGPNAPTRQRQSNHHFKADREADRVSDVFSHLFPHGILPTLANNSQAHKETENSQAHEETNASPNGAFPPICYFSCFCSIW